jgi:hypothetical protein
MIVCFASRFSRLAAAATFVAVFAVTGIAQAKDAATPDWPCVWRKVAEIDAATIWDGPSLDTAKDWQKDNTLRDLSTYIIARRIKTEDAEKVIGGVIKQYLATVPEATRDQKLTELFAASLARTNDERKIVMSGIERFHKRQLARAKDIENQGMALPKNEDAAAMPPAEEAPTGKISDLPGANSDPAEKFKWEVRVFQERQQNIPIACEIPQLMDERIGLVARTIRALMKG